MAQDGGSTNGELSFGGRRIQVSRPQVRSKSGEEASLPHFKAFREEDPLPERVLNQILVGVSTRNYESSLDKPAAKLKSRGTSKSAASRHLVSQTTKKLEQYLSRRLEEYELAALMMDGLEVAGQTVVVTLGITIDGTKVPLGIWLGSTENSQVCTAMLQDLLERGLRIDESILCVVDGGKGIRKALVDVLGDLAVIQRCRFHKLRNLRSYLPKSRHAYVLQTMKEAYKCKSADKARKQLRALVSWLERNGYDEAAGWAHPAPRPGPTQASIHRSSLPSSGARSKPSCRRGLPWCTTRDLGPQLSCTRGYEVPHEHFYRGLSDASERVGGTES